MTEREDEPRRNALENQRFKEFEALVVRSWRRQLLEALAEEPVEGGQRPK